MNCDLSHRRSAGLQTSSRLLIVLVMCAINPVGSCFAGTQSDWVKVNADSIFYLLAPAGTKFLHDQGADSFVGNFDGPGFKLYFDYGAYSNPMLNDETMHNYETEKAIVQDKQARIITAYVPLRADKFPYFIGIHFPDLGKSVIGSKKLTLFAWVERTEDYALIKEILSTIRFN